jgi:WhiB family redox-sensing transcriptional regulator
MLAGACTSVDPELFYVEGKGAAARDLVDQAKAVCARCDVRPQCLAYALERRMPFGVWGGLDDDERRAAITGQQRKIRRARETEALDPAIVEARRVRRAQRGDLLSREATAALVEQLRALAWTPMELWRVGEDLGVDRSMFSDLLRGGRKQVFSSTAEALRTIIDRAQAAQAELVEAAS